MSHGLPRFAATQRRRRMPSPTSAKSNAACPEDRLDDRDVARHRAVESA
jgi:hypothetical protein